MCRLVSHTHKKYYARKVATVCAKDVEWIECEHVIKNDPMVRLERQINELKQKILSATKREREKTTQENFTY